MHSLCHRFDVGPILRQETYSVPTHCTADQLGATLATRGAHLVSPSLSVTLPIRALTFAQNHIQSFFVY